MASATSGLHGKTWSYFALILLGLWLITIPVTFTTHSIALRASDTISGILLCCCGLWALRRESFWAPWCACLIGLWLELAPLVLWAPDSITYLNDTLVGALVLTFAIIVPGTPGERMDDGPDCPPGWTYNPSSWPQRVPIMLFGVIGWFIARYMAAFQLGYLDSVWDPIFPNGTLLVITSSVSKAFPISDAGLGACAYTLEALMAAKGGTHRWRSMPWIVVLFGILVVPLGLTSIVLVILQPLLVGHWCSWCLLTAMCMLMMIALTIDEVVAVLQYLHKIRKSPTFWQIFWHGGTDDGSEDTRTPSATAPAKELASAMTWGITIPWNLVLTALIGAYLMASPALWGLNDDAANFHFVFGALTITLSIVSMAEVVRSARFVNTLFGIIVIAFAWTLHGESVIGQYSDTLAGLLLVLLSIPKGKILERYGSWDHYIR